MRWRSRHIVACLAAGLTLALVWLHAWSPSAPPLRERVADAPVASSRPPSSPPSGPPPARHWGVSVLLERALFDYHDHVARVEAIRDVLESDQNARVRFLDFGISKFKVHYHAWCKPVADCPVDRYQTAFGELKIPKALHRGPVWHAEGWIWALEQELADPSCKWLVLGQDMLFLHMANLRAYLARFDPSRALVLGNRLRGFSRTTMVSPWGYVLSRGAAERLVKAWGPNCSSSIAANSFLRGGGGNTDYAFGLCLSKLMSPPATFVDTRDDEGRDRFMLWPPSRMSKEGLWWDSWYPSLRIDPPVRAVSPETVMFFFAGAREIRELAAFASHRGPLSAFLVKGSHSFYSNRTWRLLEDSGMRLTKSP